MCVSVCVCCFFGGNASVTTLCRLFCLRLCVPSSLLSLPCSEQSPLKTNKSKRFARVKQRLSHTATQTGRHERVGETMRETRRGEAKRDMASGSETGRGGVQRFEPAEPSGWVAKHERLPTADRRHCFVLLYNSPRSRATGTVVDRLSQCSHLSCAFRNVTVNS